MSIWQAVALDYHQDGSDFFESLLDNAYPIWLDSCAHATKGRYDIYAADPCHCIEQNQESPKEFIDKVRLLSSSQGILCGDLYFNGVLGFFGYEFSAEMQGITQHNPSAHSLPKAWFGVYAWAVVVDHHLKQVWLVYQARHVISKTVTTLCDTWNSRSVSHLGLEPFCLVSPFKSNISFEEYQNALGEIHRHLQQGDSYQVNYTHCFGAQYQGDLFEAYRHLRQVNPAEYAAFLRLPQGDILSFSPELLIEAKAGALVTKLIKGTAKRTHNVEVDYLQQNNLKNCPKNQAENMMIVDLLRNDLSRIAYENSVEVTQFLKIETLPSVFHLVSTIIAQLNEEMDYIDVLQALLPGGSITGAPKYRTMELIAQYEQLARSVYCGSIGYLANNQQMCFNIAIRTLVGSKGLLSCPAGGGIVYDSNCQSEYQETIDKVSVLIRALSQDSVCGSV